MYNDFIGLYMSFTALRQRPVDSLEDYSEWVKGLKPSKSWWSFTFFTGDFMYRERWERDNPEIKEELMLLAQHIDPLTGHDCTDKGTHFLSRNSWYSWKRFDITISTGVSSSWSMQLFPTAENPHRPFERYHMKFEVSKPELNLG